jgi:hypothetical protein
MVPSLALAVLGNICASVEKTSASACAGGGTPAFVVDSSVRSSGIDVPQFFVALTAM